MTRSKIGSAVALALCMTVGTAVAADRVSGTSTVPIAKEGGRPADVPFTAKFGYAYATGEGADQRRILVLTDAEPPVADWNAASDRRTAAVTWCGAGKGSYIAFTLQANGKAEGSDRCGKGGMRQSEGLSVMNGLPSIQAKLGVNDGKRLQGTLLTGLGACGVPGETMAYCTETGSFEVDLTLAPPPIADRVWAEGKPDAPGLADARKVLQAYWKAVGNAKAIGDLAAFLTAARNAEADADLKQSPDFAARLFTRVVVPAHAGPLTIVDGRQLGNDAVLSATTTVSQGKATSKQACRVLMRQEAGAWKVDRESCKSE